MLLTVEIDNKLSGDRINLPASALLELQHNQLPLVFRLSSAGAIVYASVREFTAPENVVQLSSFLASHLFTNQISSIVNLEYVILPKGEKVTLKSLNAVKLKDPRSELESHLRINFSTLTKHTVLEISLPNGIAKFSIEKYLLIWVF